MGLSRRFLNLIVNEHRPKIIDGYRPGLTSLRSIDLGRHELFYPPGTLPPPAALREVEQLTLPAPTFSFRGSRQGCLPVADGKVLCTDLHQHAFLFDAAATRHEPYGVVTTIPTRRFVKGMAISVFVPSTRASDDDDGDPDGTLFVLAGWPDHEKLEKNCPGPESVLVYRKTTMSSPTTKSWQCQRDCPGPESVQFEALVYRRTSVSSPAKSWQCQPLLPPPYLRDSKYRPVRTAITSYAVVGGGSHICVSVVVSFVFAEGKDKFKVGEPVGTFCLDTVSHTWSKVGDWTLPFAGKVEYVPELKLWFGISASGSQYGSGNGELVAADLSTMDSNQPPELVGTWEEIDDTTCARYGWQRVGRYYHEKRQLPHRLAYLGSGRFCIARFFNLVTDDFVAEPFAVLTGVEVTPQAQPGGSPDDGGEAKLQMISHKSGVVPSDDCIDAVF